MTTHDGSLQRTEDKDTSGAFLNFTVLEISVLYARLHLQHEVMDECAC